MRNICPRALMKSDDRDPYHVDELCAHGAERVVPDLRWRPCHSSRLFALAKLQPVISSVNPPTARGGSFLTPLRTSRRGSIRRSSSSPRGSGPACWPAPPSLTVPVS